jgi:hypothetical protein
MEAIPQVGYKRKQAGDRYYLDIGTGMQMVLGLLENLGPSRPKAVCTADESGERPSTARTEGSV